MVENPSKESNPLGPQSGFAALFLSGFFAIIMVYLKTEQFSLTLFEAGYIFLPSLIIVSFKGGFKILFSPIFPEKKSINLSLFFFLSAFPLSFAVANLINLFFDISEILEELNQIILSYNLLSQIILFALAPAFFEEIFFRGVILKSFFRFGKFFSVLLTSILFTIFHGSYQLFLPIFIMSLFLTITALFRGGLLLSIIFHFAFNLSNLIMMNFLDFEVGFTSSFALIVAFAPVYAYFTVRGFKNV